MPEWFRSFMTNELINHPHKEHLESIEMYLSHDVVRDRKTFRNPFHITNRFGIKEKKRIVVTI